MKKKGFTLIELLAVIIILAILAFILIPVIQDLIANARYGAAANSVMNYVNAANTQAAVEAGGFEEYKLNLSDTYELDSEIDTEELDKIKYKGKGPTYVYLLFSGEEKYVSEGHFCMWGYSIDYNFETGTSKSDLDYCGGEGTEPEGEPPCDVLRNNKYDDTEVFKINNVEDLVCVSELSKTKTFENKTIYLIKDIDFNSDSSYQNINDTSFGDINGNGTVEGLKVELTTGKGFNPIGSSSVPFKGTFDGYAKSISNVFIKRSQNNVGLFGYNQGIIQAFSFTSDIKGNSNVGGLVGYNDGGTIKEIIGSVVVNSYLESGTPNFQIGGLVGYNASGDVTDILLTNITVQVNKYGHYIGGLVGNSASTSSKITGVIERGSVIICGSTGYYGSWKAGRVAGAIAGSYNIYASNSVVGNAAGVYGSGYAVRTEMLNAYDKVLDTWIGGDNDSDGYYFDYENEDSSKIVIKKTTKNPIKFTLKGSGTEEKPYIIDNVQRYKEASTLAGKDGNYKFKIVEDLDFTDRHYYALGTMGNLLNSDIDGDMHTLSNITFDCAENCGLISKNVNHTIEGLKLDNITILSSNGNVGGLVGNNAGLIQGVTATNMNITGASSVGGLVGYNDGGNINEVLSSAVIRTTTGGSGAEYKMGGLVGNLISGNVTSVMMTSTNVSVNSYGHYLGGLIGNAPSSDSTITGVIEDGAVIICNDTGYYGNWKAGRVAGAVSGNINVYASNKVVGNAAGYYGTSYTFVPPTTVKYTVDNVSEEMDSLTYYDTKGLLDTVIGGDGDGSGYYLQYNGSGDSIIVVKAGNTPIPSPNPPEPGTGEPLEETKVGTNPPTCVLEQVISRENGIQPVLTCTDDEGAPTIRSQWNVNKNATTNQFSDIGIVKNGTVNGNSKTVRPYWSTSDPISVPTPNTCYYFRFGAQDASGNWSYYVTSKCYYGFGRSND